MVGRLALRLLRRSLGLLLLLGLLSPVAHAKGKGKHRGKKKQAVEELEPATPTPRLPASLDEENLAPPLEPQDQAAERQRLLDLARSAAELNGEAEESASNESLATREEELSDPELLERLLDARSQGVGTQEWRDFLDDVLGERHLPTGPTPRAALRLNLGPYWMDPRQDLYLDPMAAIAQHERLRPDLIRPQDYDYPLVVNERVLAWMDYFLIKGKKWFKVWCGRAPRFRAIIQPELARTGLPQDLFYQSMIESGFSTRASSRVGAGGIWQFMPRTGRHFGLEQSYWIDERRDPWLATEAAAEYMTYLYARFGDWWLASASYNAGEGKIGKAIKRYESRNFWVLSRGDYLKPETKNYVPKILASAIVHHNLKRYGMDEGLELQAPWAVEGLEITGAIDVAKLAEFAGVAEADLKVYNPALIKFATPPDTTLIHIPVGKVQEVATSIESIPASERVSYATYTVRRGDVLSKIARHYGVSVSQITTLNRIRNARSLRIGQVLVLPLRGDQPLPPPPKESPKIKKPSVAKKGNTPSGSYTVKAGDTLSGIARAHKVSTKDLRSWNKLKGDLIRVGQSLRLSQPPPKTVTVAAGDSLWGLAKKLGVSVAELMKWNDLSDSSVLHPGQVLKLKIP